MIDDEYPGGLHPIPTELPADPRDDQPLPHHRHRPTIRRHWPPLASA